MSRLAALMPWNRTDYELVRCGTIAEIVGIVLLLITVLVHNPLLLVILIPLGALLVLLGWIAWVWAFVRSF
jgi:hypothetical protein